ncbi:hypothetical protein MJT46_003354 [Ovis ammon polii x Ovis aries]|nr:hypothetical protein MJT46_003354 [Ovis ammon polii x Ovis aries]
MATKEQPLAAEERAQGLGMAGEKMKTSAGSLLIDSSIPEIPLLNQLWPLTTDRASSLCLSLSWTWSLSCIGYQLSPASLVHSPVMAENANTVRCKTVTQLDCAKGVYRWQDSKCEVKSKFREVLGENEDSKCEDFCRGPVVRTL